MNKRQVFIAFIFSLLSGYAQAHGNPKWAEDVAAIIYTKCAPCHYQGGIGPFSLTSYQDAKDHGSSIRSAVIDKTMPPWKADPTYRHFQYERVLDSVEINDIVNWIDGGYMPGNMSLEPQPPTYTSKSRISSIDLGLQTSPWQITTQTDQYRSFVLPSNTNVNKYFNEVEVIPGNDAVVHHVVVSADWSKRHYARQLDAQDTDPGFETNGTGFINDSAGIIYAWAPGMGPLKYPQEFGIQIPAGADLIVEIHYSPGKKGEWDSTTVNFHYTTYASPRQIYFDPVLSNDPFILKDGLMVIPANTIKTFHQQYWMPADVTLFTIWPHMHQIGKSYKVYAYNKTTHDTIPLAWIPDWDFHWQGGYTLQKPVKIPKGYYLAGEPTYDNTSNNPNNPTYPPVDVYYGEHTTDEMMFVFFGYTLYLNGDENIILDSTVNGINKVVTPPVGNWSVYPNPSNGVVTVETSPINQQMNFTVINSAGEIVKTFRLQPGSKQPIDLETLPAGVYYISGGGRTEKVIVVGSK